MTYRHFNLAQLGLDRATLATVATFRFRNEESVATVATVADPLDEIRARRAVPSEWTGGVEQLLLTGAPRGFPDDMWRQLGEDAVRFLDKWGPEACRLGWTTLDLFGVHPAAPTVRYDAMGLVPLIRGSEVISITDRSATTRQPSGACLSYIRGVRVHAVPVWALLESRPAAEQ